MAALVVGAVMMMAVSAGDVESIAAEAGVDPIDLAGAVNSTHMEPREYLISVGELPTPAPLIPAGVETRVRCIEARESGGANVWNRHGSGAGGVMQYMPTTFARSAREMGHPEWSLWNPAQAEAVAGHDLLLGRRSQWTVGGC